MKYIDLSGIWTVRADGLADRAAFLPGTLDENKIGFKDEGGNQWHPDSEFGNSVELLNDSLILTRLTRNFTYEGAVCYSRKILLEPLNGRRVFLEAERSRELKLQINGHTVNEYIQGTLSTPYVFEITEYVKNINENSEIEITLCCDNTYHSWGRSGIIASSAATDETQTNWNGIIGYLRLRYEEPSFISAVIVYPKKNALDIIVEIDCSSEYNGDLTVMSQVLPTSFAKKVCLLTGRSSVTFSDVAIKENTEHWDEYCGAMHEITVMSNDLESFTTYFGYRTFQNNNGRLALNGRNFFLRCETNCCVFPKTGHMPMSVKEWKEILSAYKAYGVNCVRFHSHCPPSAAFTAADELGILIQPELSHWETKAAFESEESWQYYQTELRQVLYHYANHPSFVMLTFGNELNCGALGYKRMILLLEAAKSLDGTRLYAQGSNNFYGAAGACSISDFYTSANIYGTQIRGTSAMMTGHINQAPPNSKWNFDKELTEVRKEFNKPIFGFEVGQYEVLPDFDEWQEHEGVTHPDNYLHIQKVAAEKGFSDDWKKREEASGELALISYREEIEAVLRTEDYSGISLLSLQDFTGQGTALVGMLNAHLQPKPFEFANPSRFRSFFSELVPLALLDRYTYFNDEVLTAQIKIANYTKDNLRAQCRVRLTDGTDTAYEKIIPRCEYCTGKVNTAGEIDFQLDGISISKKLTLKIEINGAVNSYPIWVYPRITLRVPESVVIAKKFDEAKAALSQGKKVFLSPKASPENFPQSIQTHFTTDFWSVGTFSKQGGFMGLMLDPRHPVFTDFPTEFHSNYQWWRMCQGRAMILPSEVTPIITVIDCYARMRNMGMLVEAKTGGGSIIISSMGLMENLQYSEVSALTQCILDYMASDNFKPIPISLPLLD